MATKKPAIHNRWPVHFAVRLRVKWSIGHSGLAKVVGCGRVDVVGRFLGQIARIEDDWSGDGDSGHD